MLRQPAQAVNRVGRVLEVLGNSLGQKSVELLPPILMGRMNGAAQEGSAQTESVDQYERQLPRHRKRSLLMTNL